LRLTSKFFISLFSVSFSKSSDEDTCKAELGVDKGFCEAPWPEEFTLLNYGLLEGSKDRNHDVVHSCSSSEEFERFHSFYLKFMTVVREFFLPPERNRFGLVSNRSMLSSLGVGDYGPWFAVQYQAGCSSCSNILKEENDLNYVLQMNNYSVKEVNKTFLSFVPYYEVYAIIYIPLFLYPMSSYCRGLVYLTNDEDALPKRKRPSFFQLINSCLELTLFCLYLAGR